MNQQTLETLIPTGQRRMKSDGNAPANHLTADVRDAPRNRDLVRMKVVNRCTDGLQIDTFVVGPGEHEITVYEDHVPQVLAMVEHDKDAIEAARRAFYLQILNDARDLCRDFPGDTEAFMKHVESGEASEHQIACIKKIFEGSNATVESVFLDHKKRGIQPLDSAEVVTGAPKEKEPKKLLLDEDKRQYADGIADALRQVLGPIAQAVQQGGNNQSGGGNKPRQ